MSSRRVNAVLCEVGPAPGRCAVALSFRATGAHAIPDRIDDLAALGPELDLEAVRGLGKVLRLLRAARLARPENPRQLLGRAGEVSRLLERAVGTPVVLRVRARPRIRFQAWTENGIEEVNDVREVVEDEDAYWVLRGSNRLPMPLPREAVVRTRTVCTTWFQVLGIERA